VNQEGVAGDITVTLRPLSNLDVRVEHPDGKPAPRVRVKCSFSVPGESGGTSTEPTDEQGWTKLLCVATGLTLGFELEEPAPGRVQESHTITSGEPVVLRLDSQVKISGEVVDGEGRPAEGVAIIAGAPGLPLHVFEMRARRAVSGKDGRFEIDLFPGTTRVVAKGGKRGSAVAELTVDAERDPENLRLELGTATAVQVHVTGPDGEAIPQVRVDLGQRRERTSGLTDGEGWVSLPAEAGTCSISLSTLSNNDLYLPEAVTGIRRGGPPVELELVRREDRSVSGIVLHDGKPVAEARVGYWRVGGGWFGTLDGVVTCDGEGKFRLDGLYGRQIRVIAWGPGFAIGRSEIVEVPRRCRIGGIQVPSLPGIDFDARVTDPDGKPVEGFTVEIWGKEQDPPIGMKVKTTADGIFRVPRMPQGEYRIQGRTFAQEMSFGKDFSWTGNEGRPDFQLIPNRR